MKYNMVYLNVTFQAEIKDEYDLTKVRCFVKHAIESGITMKEIASWCRVQGIGYSSSFEWKKEYGILANVWNLYSYIRLKLSEKQKH